MFRFLGQQVLFKAVPRPVSRLSNVIPRFVNSSQSNVDVGSAGTDGSLQFWLDRLEKERLESSEETCEEIKELLDRFEKERRGYSNRIEDYLVEVENLKVVVQPFHTMTICLTS